MFKKKPKANISEVEKIARSLQFIPFGSIFDSKEIADEAMQKAMADNVDAITEHLMDRTLRQYTFEIDMDKEIGVFMRNGDTDMVRTKTVGLVIHEDKNDPNAIYVYTAYPWLKTAPEDAPAARAVFHGSKPIEQLARLMYYDGGTVDLVISNYVNKDDPDGRLLGREIHEILNKAKSDYEVGMIISEIAREPINMNLPYRQFLETCLLLLTERARTYS